MYLLSFLLSHCNHVENVHGRRLSIIRIIVCFYLAPRPLLTLHSSNALLVALQSGLIELWIIRRQLDVPL